MPEPQRFVNPRRFSEVFQASEDWPGTLGQQVAVREALHVEHGSNQHKWLQKLDREVNRRNPVGSGGLTFLPVAFADTGPYLAFAGATGVVMSYRLTVEAAGWIVPHEVAHCYEQLDLLTQDDKTWFMSQMSDTDRDWTHHTETFADAFRDWWRGVGWNVMTNRLLR